MSLHHGAQIALEVVQPLHAKTMPPPEHVRALHRDHPEVQDHEARPQNLPQIETARMLLQQALVA